jgi:hypothetical protein
MKRQPRTLKFLAVSAGPYRADEKQAEIVSTVGGTQREYKLQTVMTYFNSFRRNNIKLRLDHSSRGIFVDLRCPAYASLPPATFVELAGPFQASADADSPRSPAAAGGSRLSAALPAVRIAVGY